MLQIMGFESTQSINSLADEINRWLVSNTEAMGTKFRLINIQYSSTPEQIPNSAEHGHINYSALVTYEVGEIKKTEDSTEPLDTSGVE
jgi:hypothetical protein